MVGRLLLATLLAVPAVRAHCPLCTVGAAAAAGGAAYLGVNPAAIGVFIGAAAVLIGWWIARLLKPRVPFQKTMIILFSFVTTVWPLTAFLTDPRGLYIPYLGSYGTMLVIDLFLAAAVIGGLLVSTTPWLSKRIARLRDGKILPYQGVALTLGLLIIAGALMQLA